MNKKVSVLITTYNLEKYIANTLETVINQDVPFDFEILVGDDGSNDETVKIIKEYIRKYPGLISLFEMPREEGVQYNRVERSAANRINLLNNAKGEYVSFLDGDDFYTCNTRLADMVKILEKPENKDCIMSAHNLTMYYEDKDGFPLCSAKKEHKWGIKDYWPAIFIQANALLFRNILYKSTIRKDLINNEALLNNFDDNNITFWLFKYGKMYYVPKCYGAYRQVAGSSWNGIDELRKHCSNMIGYNIECQVNPEARKYIIARHYPDFKYIYEHRTELSKDNCSPFYETAERYNLKKTLNIYNLNSLEKKYLDEYKKLISKSKLGYLKFKSKRSLTKLFKLY